MPSGGPVHHGADCTGLGEQSQSPGLRHARQDRGVETDLLRGVDETQTCGAHHAHTGRAGNPYQAPLLNGTVRAGLRVAAGHDDHRPGPGSAAIGNGGFHGVPGDGNDCEVDLHGDVLGARHESETVPLERRVTHPVEGARVAAVQNAFHGVEPGMVRVRGRPDHGHDLRSEQILDGAGLGTMFAGFHHGQRLFGGVDVEIDHHHAIFELPGDVVSGLHEHVEHFAVLGEHLRGESIDPVLAGGRGQVLQQDGPDAAALVVVRDHERDFRRTLGGAVVATYPDHPGVQQQDETHAVHMVHGGESCQFFFGQRGFVGEEPEVDAVLGLLAVELGQQFPVVRADRPQMSGGTVTHDDVCFPVFGVGR